MNETITRALAQAVEDHWLQATAFLGGLAATGFSVWYTAKRTVLTSIQQKVWGAVYDEKRSAITAFSEALISFSQSVHLFSALKGGLDSQDLAKSRAIAGGILVSRFANEPGSRDLTRLRRLLPALGAQPTPAAWRKRDRAYAEIHVLLIGDLLQALNRIKDGYNRLSLLVRDPRQVRPCYVMALNVLNQIGEGQDGFRKIDYDATNARWLDVTGLARLHLRQDLERSVSSLEAALEHSPEWETYMQTPGTSDGTDPLLKPILILPAPGT